MGRCTPAKMSPQRATVPVWPGQDSPRCFNAIVSARVSASASRRGSLGSPSMRVDTYKLAQLPKVIESAPMTELAAIVATAVRASLQMRRGDPWGDVYEGIQLRSICPNCGAGTALSLESTRWVWPRGADYPKEHDDPPHLKEHVWMCTYCNKSSVLLLELGGTDDPRVWQVWPDSPPRQLPEVAPEEARSLFQEASLAEKAGALRGAAGLYRACVEALLDDQGIDSGRLQQRIERLRDKGVEDDLISAFHEARLTGNWSLHDGVQFSQEEIADVAGLIVDAVEELYVIPAQREQMRDARAARRAAQSQVIDSSPNQA